MTLNVKVKTLDPQCTRNVGLPNWPSPSSRPPRTPLNAALLLHYIMGLLLNCLFSSSTSLARPTVLNAVRKQRPSSNPPHRLLINIVDHSHWNRISWHFSLHQPRLQGPESLHIFLSTPRGNSQFSFLFLVFFLIFAVFQFFNFFSFARFLRFRFDSGHALAALAVSKAPSDGYLVFIANCAICSCDASNSG